jgi:predicted outer membrane repeat protein
VFWINTTVTLNHLTMTQGYIGFGGYGGGAIHNSGTLTLLNSTITNSKAPVYGRAGGIYNDSNAYLNVTNSTFSGNSAYYYGGAIYSNITGHVTITNSTLVGNAATTGGGIYAWEDSYLTMTNTLIANSSGADCSFSGTLASYTYSHNLIGDGTCLPSVTGSPVLGPLADNGGPTPTYALWPGSPAIDAGTNSGCPAADQRGQARPVNTTCDIGAYERSDGVAPAVTSFSAPPSSNSLAIPITSFSGADNAGISGYLVTLSSTVPSNTAAGWSAAPPATVTVGSSGDFMLYPWILDKAGNVSTLYGSPASVRVDVIPPDTFINSTTPPDSYTASTSMSIAFSGSDNYSVASFVCSLDGGSFSACTSPWSAAHIANGSHTFQVAAIDGAGNQDPTPASFTWQVDHPAPSPSISASFSDPTNAASVWVSISFSDSVTGFTLDDVSVENGAAASLTGSGANYSAEITPAGEGLVRVAIPAGVAQDSEDVANTASTPFEFTCDYTAPTVTIEQAAWQGDPSGGDPVLFIAIFNETVTGFSDADVTISGTAGATTASVTQLSYAVYQVAVSGMAQYGTVIASIGAGVADDLAGNGNTASSSSDNSVYFLAPSSTTIGLATPADSLVGEAFSASFTVAAQSPFSGRPSGSVTVTDGVDSCTGTLAAGSCDLTLTTLGERTLSATYHGDANFVESASAGLAHTVNQAPAITSPASAGFHVGVMDFFPVTLSGYPLPVVSISGAQALPDGLSLYSLPGFGTQIGGTPRAGTGGVYRIDLEASNGIGADARQTLALTVREAPAITSANGFSLAVGVSGQFAVHTYGYPQPALAVAGELPIGVVFTDAGDGSAAFSGTPAVGTDGEYPLTLQADNASGAPASQPFTLVVGKNVPALQVAPSVSAAVFGQEVTISAIPAAGLTLPTGLVTFVVDGVIAGDPRPLVDGVAALRIHTLAVGSHTFSAAYSGDGYYRSSRGAAAQPLVVTPAGTALSLSVRRGASPELTVTVSAAAPGAGTPTGQVRISVGDQLIGSGDLDGSGKTIIKPISFPSHPYTLTVTYAGDGNFATSQQVFRELVIFIPLACSPSTKQ